MAAHIIMEKTDEALARRVQQGHVQDFAILVDRYQPKMKRYGRKFLFGYEDIEDSIQEVFIKAFRNIQSFDVTRKFSPWLYRIAHNEFVNTIKKKGREKISFFDPDTLFPHLVSPEETDTQAHKKEAKKVLEYCLERLEPKYREVLVLYYLEELNYQEIADILQIPLSTVGVRLNRARQKAKEKALQLGYSL